MLLVSYSLCKSLHVFTSYVFQTHHLSVCFGFSDGKDLLGTVAELKHAHHKLSEQNSSLLKTVAQCEDINLQLTLETTELRAKLVR